MSLKFSDTCLATRDMITSDCWPLYLLPVQGNVGRCGC